ncbi:porin family protein [Flavobacterium sp. SM2513]|uniref:porin family protein n=1 Tax=Flavobacterium sp. SM2513 TaxID=3424766 RepID=UPI003D7FAB5A
MKKTFITAVFALGFIFTSSAQVKGDVEFGINIGLNTSTVTAGNFSANTGIGFNAGFASDYYFSDGWSIKGKLIYDQKGWDNGTFEDEISVSRADYNLNYLTIPLMANWHFGNKKNWYCNFGPYAGFLLNAKESAKNTDVSDAFNSNDFGLALGIGVKIPVSDKLRVYFEYEGQSGFSDIFKNNLGDRVTGSRNAFNVGLNFMMK